jgi:hypothetical protein
MERKRYFDGIEVRLNFLAFRIEKRGKQNLLDLNIHAEDFYRDFFNLLFSWNLVNLNQTIQNSEAIDLFDSLNKIIVQVSSSNTKKKIQDTLDKKAIDRYSDYSFKFIAIANNGKKLRRETFKTPDNIKFTPSQDIFDITLILDHIRHLPIDKLEEVYLFLWKELKIIEPDSPKLDSNLAKIINILSEEDWNIQGQIDNLHVFNIERKIDFNNLVNTKPIIDDYKIHYNRVDQKYAEFDKMGKNKSNSVLGAIRKIYIDESTKNKNLNDDKLLMLIIEKVIEKVEGSPNYERIPIEELDLCVSIFVVDAFIRCKIFKNPEDYSHVIA